MLAPLLVFLKLYLIVGEAFFALCLAPDGCVVAELRQVRSFARVLSVALLSVALWPLAFVQTLEGDE